MSANIKILKSWFKQLYKTISLINIQIQHDPARGARWNISTEEGNVKVFVFIGFFRIELSAASWGKYGRTSWTPPPQPPSSSTLQITLAVASGAQIITLCYFSSHTLLLKLRLPGCLSSNSIPACHRSRTPSSGYEGLVEVGWWLWREKAQSVPNLCRFPKAQVNQNASMPYHRNSTMCK